MDAAYPPTASLPCSGIGGGKFLERQKIYKPESEESYTCQARGSRHVAGFPTMRGWGSDLGMWLLTLYSPAACAPLQDLYVGGHVEVFHRGFELTDADEYTYVYQENNKHIFLMADADAAAKTLRAQLDKVNMAQGGHVRYGGPSWLHRGWSPGADTPCVIRFKCSAGSWKGGRTACGLGGSG